MKTTEQDEIIILDTFNDLTAATIAKSKLETNGIKAFLEEENVVGLNPLGGVELKIFLKDREKAKEIL